MDSLTSWVSANLRWLRAQLTRGGRTKEDADDLIQEAYLRVFQYCERGQAREPEKVLVRTVMRLSMNADRDRRLHDSVDHALYEFSRNDLMPSPEDVLAAEQSLRQVVETLDAVSVQDREAFLLHRIEGFSYSQIAEQMGVSVSAIEKRIAWTMAVLLDAAERDRRRS